MINILMTTTLTEKRLRSLIREGVREAIGAEFAKIRALALSEVSVKEQRDIEKRYGKPSRKYGRGHTLAI